jgi:hypothetical protein
MLNILEQLLKNNFIYQYSSKNNKWCNKYKYDFYFMLNEEQYIIETHGKQHYYKNCGWDKLDKTQLNDEFKKELALSNGIKEDNYIIIDCRESNLDWIKQNILSSTLSKIFNLNNIDWFKTEKFTCSNLIKVACEYKKNNPNLTTTQIGDILGHNRSTINRWLKTGSKFNWCEYDTREEKSKISRNSSKNKGKNIIIIKNEKTIGIFHSSHDLSRQSEKLFGTKLDYRNISAVATDIRKFHKGYTFKYVKDLTEDEYIKYDIENKLKELK